MLAPKRSVAECESEVVISLESHPGKQESIYGIHVCQGLPTGSMTLLSIPQKSEYVFPKERFVTYEESDAKWAVPLGIAKVVHRNIRSGDMVDVTLNNETMKVAVTYVGVDYQYECMPKFKVDFYVVSFFVRG